MSAGSHLLCYCGFLYFLFFFNFNFLLGVAAVRHFPLNVFTDGQPITELGGIHPPLFLFTVIAYRGRSLWEHNVLVTVQKQHPHRVEGGARVRAVTQGVYTALFFLLSTGFFFIFIFLHPNGLWTCEYTTWLLQTSSFPLHIYILLISSFLGTKHCEIVFFAESRTVACFFCKFLAH